MKELFKKLRFQPTDKQYIRVVRKYENTTEKLSESLFQLAHKSAENAGGKLNTVNYLGRTISSKNSFVNHIRLRFSIF